MNEPQELIVHDYGLGLVRRLPVAFDQDRVDVVKPQQIGRYQPRGASRMERRKPEILGPVEGAIARRISRREPFKNNSALAARSSRKWSINDGRKFISASDPCNSRN